MNLQKMIPALAASLLITLCVGMAIFAVGGNALFNGNGIAFPSATTKDAAAAQIDYASQAAQIKELQAQVAEYQSREQQYQTQLNEAAQQITQAKATIQQFQALLDALQRRGIITVSSDGRIFLNQ
ncbi:MAG: hypothetical protein HYZ25_13335 [Chloroflexi bacterium]|jgi:peptidoglycan hydrolase CwlO-like protein|nr:hypothetical protein [Chloroflexota bacterium]